MTYRKSGGGNGSGALSRRGDSSGDSGRRVRPATSSHSGRIVTTASSLSARFQQAHLQRTASTGISRAAAPSLRAPGKQSRRPGSGRGRRALQSMDIDQGPRSGGPSGRQRGRGGSPSRRGGRRGTGRGGRGGSRRGGRVPPNKDKLDMDLDNYMLGDSKTGRSILDTDLDKYMSNATA